MHIMHFDAETGETKDADDATLQMLIERCCEHCLTVYLGNGWYVTFTYADVMDLFAVAMSPQGNYRQRENRIDEVLKKEVE
jgi:hypothetical protein